MDNSKTCKPHKTRKPSKKSQSLNTSSQKENVPKIQKKKVTKSRPDPNESIAMSQQLLQKKTYVRSKRGAKSCSENRVCGNGKPIPSLADLEKMFEDSDEDDQPPQTLVRETCTTPSHKKMLKKIETPDSLNENKLLSPTTINKLSEKLLDMISNISNPIELLDDVPPPPVVPQKKRKKPEEPYIVGCKDRPQVIRQPNANFCKGDKDYGIQGSGDPEEPPTKRAKKSNIPSYSKSIFNASADEIAAKLAKDEAGGLSDGSSDSNKTIEYDPTLFRNQRPHRFSPLPSTSKDNETFMKNDKLFNDSLRDGSLIEDENPIKKEDEVEIIDTPYETIVIDNVGKSTKKQNTSEVYDTNINQHEKTIVVEDVVPVYETNNDDDCVLVATSTQTNSPRLTKYSLPIDIDDEYGDINVENITFDQDVIEVIDIDDVIAENKSILDKWRNNGEKLDKINTVVNVPNTYRNSNTPQTSAGTPSINNNLDTTNGNIYTNLSITNNNSPTTPPYQVNVDLTTGNINNSIPFTGDSNCIQTVVTDFFQNNATAPRTKKKQNSKSQHDNRSCMRSIFDAVCDVFQRVRAPAIIPARVLAQPVTHPPPPSRHISNQNYVNSAIRPCTPNTMELSQQTSTVSASRTGHSYVGATGTASGQASQVTAAPIQATLPPRPQKPEASRYLGECPICMDPLSGNGIASTICGHVFCLKCIKEAIKASGKKCPTCRKVLKGVGYHQLYL